MKSFLIGLALASSVLANLRLPSFQPQDYPPSTRDNDGTNLGRYDVRKTIAFVDEDIQLAQCHFFLVWITSNAGQKYHATICPCVVGQEGEIQVIYSLNDLNALKSVGATGFFPATASNGSLGVRSSVGTLQSPMDSDNYSNLMLTTSYGDVISDLNLHPTGKNLYVGGSGGFTLPPYASDVEYNRIIPGYSWYWGNPNLRVNGTFKINNEIVEIDPAKSFAYYERQWGRFDLSSGYFAFWIYLPTGEVVHTWLLAPHYGGDGKVESGITTIWHPNGVHEISPIDFDTTQAWNIWSSEKTNTTYFHDFQLDMPAINASLHLSQFAEGTDVSPVASGDLGAIISEAYMEGTGTWRGKPVEFFGHIEQLPPTKPQS